MWSYCTSAHTNERCVLQHNVALRVVSGPVLEVAEAVEPLLPAIAGGRRGGRDRKL